MPKASIVIPCYNASAFIDATLQSAVAQTMDDLEIVCVNDGSTDDTLKLLESWAQKDARIRVLSQQNGGEGPARDAGLQAAQGDWLYFLDADDLMEPTLLEHAIQAGEENQSDVVIFRTILLDAQTGAQDLCWWSFKRTWVEVDTFDPREYPDYLFNSFQNWVHNKLFRGSFVREHGLAIQHVHRTADLLFSCRALAEAGRITLLDEPLYQYRVNNPQSAIATSDSYPLDFYEALIALREALDEAGTWELYRRSFVDWAIENIAANLRLARTYEGYRAIADTMVSEGFDRLGITGFSRDETDMPQSYDQVMAHAELPPEKALFALAKWYDTELDAANSRFVALCRDHEAEIRRLEEEIRRLEEEIARRQEGYDRAMADVMGSASMRIGRAITALPRLVRDLVRRGTTGT